MRILIWHVHGSWTTAFVQGGHDLLLPVVPGRDAWGRGRASTWTWPERAREVPVQDLAATVFDLVIVQRPEELDLVADWTGRRPGQDVPAIYVEHNTPGGAVPFTRHPLAGRDDIPVVHVTHFNRLMWDCGAAPTHVIEHGVPQPGARYRPELPHAGVVVNDPVRRGRAVGTDLLGRFAARVPLEVFGMGVERLADAGIAGIAGLHEDYQQSRMHRELARCSVYLHPHRWTSLGLSLIEAMMMGMPVVGLATTEAADVLPPDVAVLGNDIGCLCDALAQLVADPEEAMRLGERARAFAVRRFGVDRFLADWERLLDDVAAGSLSRP